ncbi:MAG TPA: DUF4252 domain-containing protein [Thermoanaerobaculia bacterium]|jgi:hypothetical protein|nr:DUF4252 domain-containing protein [Thermoanaerobaculia bacterium]
MKRGLLSFVALVSLSSLLAGCGGSPTVQQVRWELQRRFPEARFEPEEHVHLGRISMGLVHGFVNLAASDKDDREGRDFVRQIHGVDFASYKVRNLPDLTSLTSDTRFESQLKQNGWSLMVRTREEHESTWIYVRSTPDGAIRNLFVVSLEKDELTLVRVDGRLDRAFAAAMAEHPRKMFDGGHRKKEVKTGEVGVPAGL